MNQGAMLTVIAQAPDGGPAPLAPQVGLFVIIVALAASWGLYRLSTIESFERFRPYVLLGFLALWGLAIVEGIFLIAHMMTPFWLPVGLFILASGVLTNYQWLRNVTAGVSLAFEGRLSTGDAIRIDEFEGAITHFGLRSTCIRGIDGRTHEVPNAKLVDEAVSNLEAGGDSACDIYVSVPDQLPQEEARQIAHDAATLSPLASPRHEAEVFVESDQHDRLELRIRGFAFDAAQQDRYKSDVRTRLAEAFES